MTPIEEIKSKIGILDVVSSYVRVEKSGSQYKARCPFHNEKSPSFYISPARGSYHCFGCGVGGDIFGFVQGVEHVEFKEALKMLAERAGVTLDYKKNDIDNDMLDLLREASLFYQICMSESIDAKKYLHDRGLLDETMKEYEIGYAKSEWRTLFVHLSTKGYSPEQMVDAGLVIAAEGNKYYDRFRGRIMFPIKNISGSVVGFTGRVLPEYDDGKTGKYVNTPETKLYHKSKILFNYDKAKRHIADSREVILAEGQMDVIMSSQIGIKNLIAVSGTAFTEEQVKIISRLADKVTLAFDNDNAGRKAADKAAIMCAYGGMQIYAVDLKEKDIADMVKSDSATWLDAYKNKSPLINSYAGVMNKITDQSDKLIYIKNQVLPYLRAVQSDVERDFNIADFARLTAVSADSIRSELKKISSLTPEISQEISQPRISNNKEDIMLDLHVLKRELKIDEDLHLDINEEDLPSEIYNRKVMELEQKHLLDIDSYKAIKRTYIQNILKKLHEKYADDFVKLNELNILKKRYSQAVDPRPENPERENLQSIELCIMQLVISSE